MFEENQDVQFYLTCEITCSICSSKLLRLPVKYEIHTHTHNCTLYIIFQCHNLVYTYFTGTICLNMSCNFLFIHFGVNHVNWCNPSLKNSTIFICIHVHACRYIYIYICSLIMHVTCM